MKTFWSFIAAAIAFSLSYGFLWLMGPMLPLFMAFTIGAYTYFHFDSAPYSR